MKKLKGLNNHHYKHGHTRVGCVTRTYNSWRAMLHRCSAVNDPAHKCYREDNVNVCDRWNPKKTKDAFSNFLTDLGKRPNNKTLGRHFDIGDYTPDNCNWQTPKEQGVHKWSHRLLSQWFPHLKAEWLELPLGQFALKLREDLNEDVCHG
jgi:hypothetical protein